MKQNIIAGIIMLVMLLTGFSVDSFAQPGKKRGHHKGHGHHKHHKHYRQPERVVHHHYYREPARTRTVVVPAPAPHRVYVPAPRVVAPPVPVVVIPRNAPVPPLPSHPGIIRR